MIVFVLILLLGGPAASGATLVKVPRGVYQPLFRDPGEVDQAVGPLLVDQTPVTNKDFLEFVKKNPEFMKSKVKPLFTDANYLSHWKDDLSFASGRENYPVVNVSWFVARRYCESRGMRLPTIAEWEYFSDAQSPENEARILKWYSDKNETLRPVRQGPANKFGLHDIHGHIWEWVENFSEIIMSGDSRGGSSTESLYCGGAALKAKDPKKYAAFMRFAFRSSLKARSTVNSLGFRCVKSLDGGR